ncbi:SDR family oxidoreductase [Mycolicibacterium sp.]|uniref:SDR family oxidoreductase n=1 Tax=Mycolicibacterium sp. TaxID=2320850 RepID=UPI001A28F23B|nr:SDR family oxidoreductase [Mycolicibacterium sp.]MBJ7400690.1 SDR family oxidoreductase [Mycolicibacterium sp.]
MDLGIAGRRALLCGSTRGLGLACAESLAREGVDIVINGRSGAAEVAAELAAQFDVSVVGVDADINTEAGRNALLAACPKPDILVTNNAGPPPSIFVDTTPEAWQAAVTGNMLAPLQMIQAVLPGMRERRFGRIVNITSAMVTTPNVLMTPSVAARAGLTGVTKAIAGDCAADNVTVNNLLPERINTGRQRQMADFAVATRGITLDEAYAEIAATIAAKRLGRPEEVGDACAYLCSVQASFVSGLNMHIDGGSYRGLI